MKAKHLCVIEPQEMYVDGEIVATCIDTGLSGYSANEENDASYSLPAIERAVEGLDYCCPSASHAVAGNE